MTRAAVECEKCESALRGAAVAGVTAEEVLCPFVAAVLVAALAQMLLLLARVDAYSPDDTNSMEFVDPLVWNSPITSTSVIYKCEAEWTASYQLHTGFPLRVATYSCRQLVSLALACASV